MQMKITKAQADRLMAARTMDRSRQKAERKAVYAQIRADHGIARTTKLKVAIEDPLNPMYCVIRSKYTGLPLDNGIAETPVANVPVSVGSSPVNAPELPAAKPAAKKAKAASNGNGKTEPFSTPAAKKGKSAAKAGKVVAPAKKAPAAKAAKPAAIGGVWPRDFRATIGGKRVRLGEATSEAHAKKLVAKYKKQHGID